MALRISDFKGHRVWISFVRAVEANGFQVRRMEGEFGGAQGMSFTLDDITAAIDVEGNDVTKVAKLLHGAIAGDMRNVAAIESPTPVHRDDEDDDEP
jgi:hypothetical protein